MYSKVSCQYNMRLTHAHSLFTLTVYPYRTPSVPASPPAGHTYNDLIYN